MKMQSATEFERLFAFPFDMSSCWRFGRISGAKTKWNPLC